jgi:hypothetical protein
VLGTLDRDAPWLVACRTGTRATMAASILDAAGIAARPVVDGGVPALPPDELRPSLPPDELRPSLPPDELRPSPVSD